MDKVTIREAAEIVPDVEKMRVDGAVDAEERARAEGYAAAKDEIVAYLKRGTDVTEWSKAWEYAAECIESSGWKEGLW